MVSDHKNFILVDKHNHSNVIILDRKNKHLWDQLPSKSRYDITMKDGSVVRTYGVNEDALELLGIWYASKLDILFVLRVLRENRDKVLGIERVELTKEEV